MNPGLWVLVVLGAVALAGWAYGMREERVAGRAGPAAVRAAAVFLILGALALPATAVSACPNAWCCSTSRAA